MSEVMSQYRSVFTQQRLFNYGSILLSVLIIALTWAMITLEASLGWIAVVPYLAFYSTMVMGSRVRTNPLIRCTIENADSKLYGNLWGWSVVACVVILLAYTASCVVVWNMIPAFPIDLKSYILLCAINGGLLAAVAVE